MSVRLYSINSAETYTELARSGYSANSNSLQGNTPSFWAPCGVRYQTATLHAVTGYSNTIKWSTIFRVC